MKLVLVSNRLPFSLRAEGGHLQLTQSPGGLASGLRTYLASPACPLKSGYVWVGWSGSPIPAELQEEATRRCCEELSARPVFLSREETRTFYEGFCNHTLWPLFHYFPSLVGYDEGAWNSYEQINRRFCEAVVEVAQPGDLIWVHDYHLLLLPALLRQKLPGARVGFFLHIPFPSYEIFRLLPDRWRAALLDGLLGADLIGFHTHDYTQHFLKCVRRILGFEHELGQVVLPDRVARADTFPMGIDFDGFSRRAGEEGSVRAGEGLRRPLGDCRLILSIDRLDYTKGIANRLRAYEAFLEDNPSWRGRTVLLMVVVPSRIGVVDYRKMKSRIDQLVGHINGKFGTLTWTPVLYQFRSLPQEQLVPLYAASEVMLVTPLRDGMNLVAKEYVACRADETGVLILSEMAGAASELGEALVVNPNDVPGVARAIKAALETPVEDQRRGMAAMRLRLRRYDVARWAGDFLDALRTGRSRLDERVLTAAARDRIVRDFRAARRRLVLLDYDGTLLPFNSKADRLRPSPELLRRLARLAEVADVVILSGRTRADLEGWFGELPVHLAAEDGAWVRERGGDWAAAGRLSGDWKPRIRELMERYADRLPGASVEEGEVTLSWHFRQADPELAALRARELADHLISLTETADLRVVEVGHEIEVRPSGVGKGVCGQAFAGRGYDFVLAVGTDATDEELFKVLPPPAYSIRIGVARSYARFSVRSRTQARDLLEALSSAL
jgi:trehalose 6-phosphate synthase/phosphatase